MPSPPRLLALLVALTALLVACSDDDAATPTGGEATATTPVPTTAPVTHAVTGASVSIRPGPHSVLTAVVRIQSDEPVNPRVTARTPGQVVRVPRIREPGTDFDIPLVGLRAESAYSISVGGSEALARASRGLRFVTGALPDDLPRVEVPRRTRQARDGFTLFNVSPGTQDLPLPGQLIAVDDQGEVVWYHQDEQNIADARQLPNGNLLFNYGNIGAREVDVLGNVVHDWTTSARVRAGRVDGLGRETYVEDATVLDTIRLHHYVAELLPNGNYLALGMEVREVDGFPDDLCGSDDPLPDGPRPIRGDIVLEYTPDGRIVHEVRLLDALDPVEQPGVHMCEVKTDQVANGSEPFVDWSHANAVTLLERENVVLVSARHLNSIIALRWQQDRSGPAGEVLWQLGPGRDFRLTRGEWFFQQHDPEVQPDGTILLYDNGTERPGTTVGGGRALPYSRVAAFRIDHTGPPRTWTARQVWEHRDREPDGVPTYSDFLGDADDIGSGHVLIDHGAVRDPRTGTYSARIIELDRRTDRIVLEIRVPPGDGYGWRSYKAEHLDTLYPRDADGLPPATDPPLP